MQLGQKELLIDCAGNWGNILRATRPPQAVTSRRVCRNSPSDVVFKQEEPPSDAFLRRPQRGAVSAPIKVPAAVGQGRTASPWFGVEDSAAQLQRAYRRLHRHLEGATSSSIRFPTGGTADVSRYNDGLRGGAVKVRRASRKSTSAPSPSPKYLYHHHRIHQGVDYQGQRKGQIKIRKVDDNTATRSKSSSRWLPDESSDRPSTRSYALRLRVSISPNACVIWRRSPISSGAGDSAPFGRPHQWLLGRSSKSARRVERGLARCVARTIFIENKLYQLIEGCKTREAAYAAVDKGWRVQELLRPRGDHRRRAAAHELRFIRISATTPKRATTKSADRGADSADKHDIRGTSRPTRAYYAASAENTAPATNAAPNCAEFDSIEATKVASRTPVLRRPCEVSSASQVDEGRESSATARASTTSSSFTRTAHVITKVRTSVLRQGHTTSASSAQTTSGPSTTCSTATAATVD